MLSSVPANRMMPRVVEKALKDKSSRDSAPRHHRPIYNPPFHTIRARPFCCQRVNSVLRYAFSFRRLFVDWIDGEIRPVHSNTYGEATVTIQKGRPSCAVFQGVTSFSPKTC